MPANLSPEYKTAEAAFRQAREPRERLELLREMLRTIPKHKGTERLQADIKARIKDLSDEIDVGRRGGGHGGPALVIRPEGAAQIGLLGPPNAGKSLLHARLTASGAHDAPYPFTTQFPLPGMTPYEDVQFQLVDLPAVSSEHPVPWLQSTLQSASAALLVIDLADPACVEQIAAVQAVLATKRIALSEDWQASTTAPEASADEGDPFALRLPALLVANKTDRVENPEGELDTLRELSGVRFPMLDVSAATGQGAEKLGPLLFRLLQIVRVYTKTPGHTPEKTKPFTLRRGETVRHVARLVHRDLEHAVRYARVWGQSGFDGQQVGPEHVLADRDVVELHA